MAERCLLLKLVPNLSPHELAPPGPLARGWLLDTLVGMNEVGLLEVEQAEEAAARYRRH